MFTLLHNIAEALILEENDDERQGYLSYVEFLDKIYYTPPR